MYRKARGKMSFKTRRLTQGEKLMYNEALKDVVKVYPLIKLLAPNEIISHIKALEKKL